MNAWAAIGVVLFAAAWAYLLCAAFLFGSGGFGKHEGDAMTLPNGSSILRRLLVEAGVGDNTIEFIEQGLCDEDLVVVPARTVYLRIPIPWRRKRGANQKSAEQIEKSDLEAP